MLRKKNIPRRSIGALTLTAVIALLAAGLEMSVASTCRATFPGTIYSFVASSGGWIPFGGVITDGTDLFGTTTLYQTSPTGTVYNGPVYKSSTSGTLTNLYDFPGPTTNFNTPASTLCEDADGNLYGVLEYGGPNVDFRGHRGREVNATKQS